MSKYVNISDLAEQVLTEVSAHATATKTAAAVPKQPRIVAARELKKFADDLRAMAADTDEPSDEDLAALTQDPQVQELLHALETHPELLQHLLSEQGGMPAGEAAMAEGDPAAVGAPPEVAAAMEAADPDAAAVAAPPLQGVSKELRKISALLREDGPKRKYIRQVKAAQMLQAATSIKHLVGV